MIELSVETKQPWSYLECTPDEAGPWMILADGVYFDKPSKDGVVPTKFLGQQLYISERVRDIDTGLESVCLVWHENSIRQSTVVARRTIATSAILELANNGLMVNSHNSSLVVQYLAHLLDFHQDRIPMSYVASSCGYKEPDGKRVFKLGNDSITATEDAPLVSFDQQSDTAGILDAYRTGGNPDDWLAVARELGNYPVAAFGVAAAFLSPILNDIKLPQNPIVDFAGVSSCGKTTLLRFIASVWGYPPEANGGLIRSWNSTPVFLERLASLANELPVFLDESHNANPKEVQNIIYQYANGTGRGRGGKSGGVQKVARHRGVLFSAGEVKLSAVGNHDGIGARILGFWGSPFGEGKSDLVRWITGTAYAHYGHAGRTVLYEYMLQGQDGIERVKRAYELALARLSPKAVDGVSERLVSLCAAAEAAGYLANSVLDLGWDVGSIVDQSLDMLLANRKISSAQASIELFGQWWIQHKELFDDANSAGMLSSSRRRVHGRMVPNTDGSKGLAVMQDVIKRVLEDEGYDYRSTIAHWGDRGWIEMDKGRKTKKVRFLGEPINMIVLTKAGLLAAKGGADPEEDVLSELGYDGAHLEES